MTSLTLELGARRSWRNYPEGKFVEVGKDRNGKALYKFQASKHDITVPDDIAKGLETASNEWQEANAAARHPEGERNRMLRVSNVKRNVAPDVTVEPPLMRGLNKVVDRLVASVESLVQNFGNSAKK